MARTVEVAMPQPEEREAAGAAGLAAAHDFLSRVRDWWWHAGELDRMNPDELERMAGDLGMRGRDLKDLAARGPNATYLLYERMRTLGLTRADVERAVHGLMRDLERTCACCNDKGVCEKDLATRPDDPAWEGYCPNAVALTGIKIIKGYFPA